MDIFLFSTFHFLFPNCLLCCSIYIYAQIVSTLLGQFNLTSFLKTYYELTNFFIGELKSLISWDLNLEPPMRPSHLPIELGLKGEFINLYSIKIEQTSNISFMLDQGINEKILSSELKNIKTEIMTADSQSSYEGGVIVLVTGCLMAKDKPKRKFTQSFFLAPQDNGYYVLNDVLRYIVDSETFDTIPVKGTNDSPAVSLNQGSGWFFFATQISH